MCMQDWRVARLVRPNVIFNAATSGTIPANQQRIGLILSYGGSSLGIGLDVMVLSTPGSTVPFYNRDYNFPSEVLSVAEYGSLLTDSIQFTSAADTNPIAVIELTMPEDYLAAGLAEFISQYKLESPYGNARPPNV